MCRSPESRRPLGRAARRILALVLLAAPAGCGILDPGEPSAREAYETARARWDAVGWSHYTVELSRSCECLPEAMGPFLVRVEGGTRVSVELVSGEELPEAIADGVPTVEDLFDMVDGAIREGVHRLVVTYDPQLGSPRSVYIDVEAQVVDEELSYQVERPGPLAGFQSRAGGEGRP